MASFRPAPQSAGPPRAPVPAGRRVAPKLVNWFTSTGTQKRPSQRPDSPVVACARLHVDNAGFRRVWSAGRISPPPLVSRRGPAREEANPSGRVDEVRPECHHMLIASSLTSCKIDTLIYRVKTNRAFLRPAQIEGNRNTTKSAVSLKFRSRHRAPTVSVTLIARGGAFIACPTLPGPLFCGQVMSIYLPRRRPEGPTTGFTGSPTWSSSQSR